MQAAIQTPSEIASAGATSQNYSEIISRIEQNLGGGAAGQLPSRQIDEASGESDEKEQTIEKRPNHKLFDKNGFDAVGASSEENKEGS